MHTRSNPVSRTSVSRELTHTTNGVQVRERKLVCLSLALCNSSTIRQVSRAQYCSAHTRRALASLWPRGATRRGRTSIPTWGSFVLKGVSPLAFPSSQSSAPLPAPSASGISKLSARHLSADRSTALLSKTASLSVGRLFAVYERPVNEEGTGERDFDGANANDEKERRVWRFVLTGNEESDQ